MSVAANVSNITSEIFTSAPAALGSFIRGVGSGVVANATSIRDATFSSLSNDPIDGLLRKFPDSVVLPKIGRVSTDVLLFCGSIVVGTICMWRRRRKRRSRNNSSSNYVDPREEAQRHAWMRTNGFKDPKLYAFMGQVAEQHAKLRPVEDPEMTRKAKLQRLKARPSSHKAIPQGPLELSPDRLQTKRQGLRNVTNKPDDYHPEEIV